MTKNRKREERGGGIGSGGGGGGGGVFGGGGRGSDGSGGRGDCGGSGFVCLFFDILFYLIYTFSAQVVDDDETVTWLEYCCLNISKKN